MTSKSLFFNLIQEDVKRRLWAVALSFLMFFFSLPVTIALLIGESLRQGENREYVLSQLTSIFGFQNGWITFLMIVLSVIMGVTSFSYLHSRQKVDFYHGIPVNRTHLFWSNYMNGIFIVAVVYGINLILSIGVAAAYGIYPVAVLNCVISGFFFYLLHFAMIYAVTVLAMIMTGSVIVGIFGTVVLESFFTLVILILQLCYSQFFYTSYQDGDELFRPFLEKSSPIAIFISNMARMDAGTVLWEKAGQIAIAVVLFLLITFLALVLYKKRGSESAKKAMAFKISMPIIRIPIVILSSLFGSLFFWLIRSGIGWAVFGLLCGMLLSHCVIEIIYHFDFRKLFSDWKQMIASAIVAAVILCSFQFDWIGYDSYIPDENSIRSIAVSIPKVNDWVSYGSAAQTALGDYYWVYQDSSDYVLSHMNLNDKASPLSMVKKAVENNRLLDLEKSFFGSRDEGETNFRFSIKYNLKSGREVYRSYSLNDMDIDSELIQIYENPDFIQTVYPIFSQTPEDTSVVKVQRGAQTTVVSRNKNGTDKAMTEELLLAYQKDLSELKVETMKKENPVASIQFMTRMQADADSKREENQNSWQYSDVTSRGYYPVYPSFKNTLRLLKECQMDVDAWTSWGDIKEINIVLNQQEMYEKEIYGKGNAQYQTITDPQLISQMMSKAAIAEYSGMNPFGMRDEKRLDFTAVNTKQEEIQYTIPTDQLPASIKEILEIE